MLEAYTGAQTINNRECDLFTSYSFLMCLIITVVLLHSAYATVNRAIAHRRHDIEQSRRKWSYDKRIKSEELANKILYGP